MTQTKSTMLHLHHLGLVLTAHPVAGVQIAVNGQPAKLAVLSDQGEVLAHGQDVADYFAQACITGYHRSLRSTGHIRGVADSPEPPPSR